MATQVTQAIVYRSYSTVLHIQYTNIYILFASSGSESAEMLFACPDQPYSNHLAMNQYVSLSRTVIRPDIPKLSVASAQQLIPFVHPPAMLTNSPFCSQVTSPGVVGTAREPIPAIVRK